MPALQAGWLPLSGSLCGAPPPRPNVRRGFSLQSSLARVPADPRLPKPITHTRPRGIHAPGHSFGIIQTMLLAFANFGLERMGRNNPSGCAGKFLGGALCAKKPKAKKKAETQKKKKKPKFKILPAAGRQKRFRLLRLFPAHSFQPADEKSR